MKRLRAFLGGAVMFGLLAMIPMGCSDSDSGSAPVPPTVPTNRVYVMNMEDGILEPVVVTAAENNQSWEYTLTLENVAEEVLWYCDRPGRDSGTVTMEYFVETVWPNVFVEVAPNAILDGWIPPNVSNDGLYLILRDPVYESVAKTLTFSITLEKSTMTDQHPENAVFFEDVKITVLNNNPDAETDIYSFVQVSPTAYFEETETEGVYKLYLNDVYPESFYLQDAPGRFSFVYPTELFDMAWSNIFEDDPPNASMTSYTDGKELKVQIVTLDNPDYDAESNLLTYTATLLLGDIENNQILNSPTLFIDAQDSPSCLKQMGNAGFTKRLTVLNSCGEDSWLYMTKPAMPEQWEFWKKASGGVDVTDTLVRSPLKLGVPYHYCIPDKGAPGGYFKIFMEPCAKTGDDCIIGASAGVDRVAVNTLFEASFGCMPAIDKSKCATNPSKPAERLAAADYFDISSVAGYTVPMYMEVTNASKLTCDKDASDGSMLDMASCPSENKPQPDGYGTTMVAVDIDPATMTKCMSGQCQGSGFAPCKTDDDCTDGNTQMRTLLDAGFSLLNQGSSSGATGYQGCAAPQQYLNGHELGTPAKTWTSPSGDVMGPMGSAGWPDNTLPFNTACWYGCASTANAEAPGMGGIECDKGPKQDGSHPKAMTGYVRRLKELGMNGYAWEYDDFGANHNCAQKSPEVSAKFLVTLCPGKSTKANYPWPTGAKPYLTTQGWNWTNGTCTMVSSGGTYDSLVKCQRAHMKYKCTKLQAGDDAKPVFHDYCVPVATGGTSYDDCQSTCYKK